tara:strand:+ start:40783 stop:42204 length:1422 start_codon:yes stop_codon:yes gene_type:complete
MLFNTLTFVVFAAAFFSLWTIVRRYAPKSGAWLFLVLASSIFYGWWDWKFLFLLMGSGMLDYLISLGMARFPNRKGWLLAVSVVGNLGTLFIFKYLGLATESLGWLFGADLSVKSLTLPVGISFYTFQSMSYTIDVYRGSLKPVRNPLHFLAYLSLFPQLVAGPIVRASQLLPQLEQLPASTRSQRWQGLKKIAIGLVKKSIVADTVGDIVNFHYSMGTGPTESAITWWIVAVLFAIQIYCDFSGYSDIAIGLGRWMGLEFPENFRHPYVATSFRDYWNRWHISLSTWFRDYLYFPLARRWRGRVGTLAAVNITFIVSGLWHGAGWNFLIWGALHGFLLTFEQLTHWDRKVLKLPGGRYIAMFIVFVTVCIGLVIFRAQNFEQTATILRIMFTFETSEPTWFGSHWQFYEYPHWVLIPGAFLIYEFVQGSIRSKAAKPSKGSGTYLQAVGIALVLLAAVFLRGPISNFVYFQF